jgi:hypothetical protein
MYIDIPGVYYLYYVEVSEMVPGYMASKYSTVAEVLDHVEYATSITSIKQIGTVRMEE